MQVQKKVRFIMMSIADQVLQRYMRCNYFIRGLNHRALFVGAMVMALSTMHLTGKFLSAKPTAKFMDSLLDKIKIKH